jgi:hypothetical protein
MDVGDWKGARAQLRRPHHQLLNMDLLEFIKLHALRSSIHARHALQRCRDKTAWHFQKLARSFYDDSANQRVVEVIQDPTKATLLRHASGDALRACPHAAKNRSMDRSEVLHDSEAMHTVRTAAEEALTMALKFVFEQYNKWEGGVNSSRMDKMRFHKVFRCAVV